VADREPAEAGRKKWRRQKELALALWPALAGGRFATSFSWWRLDNQLLGAAFPHQLKQVADRGPAKAGRKKSGAFSPSAGRGARASLPRQEEKWGLLSLSTS
jgi:hypothetical protein